MKLSFPIIIGVLIGSGVAACYILFMYVGPTQRQHRQAIQKLCDIVNQQHMHDTGHDIPLDCKTLTTL